MSPGEPSLKDQLVAIKNQVPVLPEELKSLIRADLLSFGHQGHTYLMRRDFLLWDRRYKINFGYLKALVITWLSEEENLEVKETPEGNLRVKW